jgi:nitrous oxidase accessory protein NosD
MGNGRLTGVVALVALVFGAAPGFGATIVVDAPPTIDCPNAVTTSINIGIALADPGDRVQVCPGLYGENVNVNKPMLRLDGAGPDPRRRTADPTREAVISYPAPPFGVQIAANEVEFEGFTVLPAASVPAEGVGVYTLPTFSGYEIEGSLFTRNTFGLYLNSSGAIMSEVAHNAFNNNNLPGSASGNGVYTDQTLRNAVIEHNFFTRNENAAIVLTAVPGVSTLQNVEVQHNSSVADGTLTAVFESRDVEIHHNSAEESLGSAIFVGNSNTDLFIEHNRLEDGDFRGIRFNAFPGPTSAAVTVSHNDIRDMQLDGIAIAPNSVVNSEFGHNQVRDSGEDGLKINAGGNVGNVIHHNRMRGSGIHDCHDATPNNTWQNNHGRTQNRPGLCRGAVVTPPFDH